MSSNRVSDLQEEKEFKVVVGWGSCEVPNDYRTQDESLSTQVRKGCFPIYSLVEKSFSKSACFSAQNRSQIWRAHLLDLNFDFM